MPNPADAKKVLATLLRENGFQGSAPTFRRFEGKASVAVVNLQASRVHPSGTYVNLGVHLRGLEKPSSWEKIQEYECAFRERLQDFAGGDVFFFDDDASMTALVEMMKLKGIPWLAKKAAPKKATAKKPTPKKATAKKPTPKKATAKKKAASVKRGGAKKSAASTRKAPQKATRTPKKKKPASAKS